MKILAGLTIAGSLVALSPQPAPRPLVRTVKMGDKDIEEITARPRYGTVLVFPSDELITYTNGGDTAKDRWGMEHGSKTRQTNIFAVKPVVGGAETNLTVETTDGEQKRRSYSFILRSCPKCQPDTKVFIEHRAEKAAPVVEDPHVREIAGLEAKVKTAEQESSEAKEQARASAQKALAAEEAARQEVTEFRKAYPVSMQTDYTFKRMKEPFLASAIWNDGEKTFIQILGEMSSVYTLHDGKPEVLQFEAARTSNTAPLTYTIDHVVKSGYLSLGHNKLRFDLRKNQ